MPLSPTAPAIVGKAVNKAKALQLRVAGLTHQQIADQLGISRSTVSDYVREALDESRRDCTETAEQLRQIELQRLEALHARENQKSIAFANTTDPDTADAGTRATVALIKISERRARLLGLDAALSTETKIRVVVEPIMHELQAVVVPLLLNGDPALAAIYDQLMDGLRARLGADIRENGELVQVRYAPDDEDRGQISVDTPGDDDL